jgi:hypothetical protein
MGTGGNPSGGSKGSGGAAGAGGLTGTPLGPCDIYTANYEDNQPVPTTWKYVTGLVKGDKGNHWTIKVGNAQSGVLTTPFDGPRPSARSRSRPTSSLSTGSKARPGVGSRYWKFCAAQMLPLEVV